MVHSFTTAFLLLAITLSGLIALPYIHVGVWVDTEGISIALNFLLALLGLTWIFKDFDKSSTWKLPKASLPLLGITVLAFCFLPLHPQPLLSFLGSPNLGYGILFLLEVLLLIFILVNTSLLTNLSFRIALVCVALIFSIFSTLSLTYPKTYSMFAIHGFSSWLAIPGLALLSLSLLLPLRKNFVVFETRAALLICYLSGNKSVYCGLLLSAIIYGLSRIKRIRDYVNHPILSGTFVLSLPIVLTFCVFLLANFKEATSLHSRIHLWQTVVLFLKDHPFTFLYGQGYGQFGDIFLQYFTKLNISLYENGIYTPSSDVLTHLDYYCMNFWGETLLATGTIGVLLALSFPFFLWFALPLKKRLNGILILIPLCAYLASWFELPTTLPWIAIIYACFLYHGASLKIKKAIARAFIVLLSCVFMFFGTMHFREALFYTTDGVLIKHFPPEKIDAETLLDRPGPGQIYLSHILRDTADSILTDPDMKEDAPLIAHDLLKTLNNVSNPTLEFDIAAIHFLSKIFQQKLLPIKTYHKVWEKISCDLQSRAPFRTDALAAFFLYSLKENPKSAFLLLNKILLENANDPVGSWFYGVWLKQNLPTSNWKIYLNKALTLEVDRFIPISTKTLLFLNNQHD